MISDVVSSYEGQVQKQNITVNVGEIAPIISNADALTNLFSQFLDNALKFNPSDNQHRQSTSAASNTNNTLSFSLKIKVLA